MTGLQDGVFVFKGCALLEVERGLQAQNPFTVYRHIRNPRRLVLHLKQSALDCVLSLF